ncbi:hypothetical protein SH528x_005842 [Novipirellula sp. SH528]|uniref:hypothetical protein n=1 Tax=Novipirellula sp. SH528 TaxID=3454466 RepID=UPI003FA0C28D
MSNRLNHRTRGINRLARTVLLAGLSLVVLGTGGCSMFSGAAQQLKNHDGLNDFMIGHRNKTMAAKAWHCQKVNFCNPSNAFKDGFYAGYMDVCNGGNGCTPATAPPQYWGWMYQSSNGQLAVNDWFAGFPMGVKAAEQDGVGHWSNVQTSYGGPSPDLAAPMPSMAEPVYQDHEYGNPVPLESPFMDADEDAESSGLDTAPRGGTGPVDRLRDEGESVEKDSVFHLQNNGGYSFSESSDQVPDLEPKHSAETRYSDVDALDADEIVNQVFADQPVVNPAATAADSAVLSPASGASPSKLPFSFQ